MIEADRVHSTPPLNASVVQHSNPPPTPRAESPDSFRPETGIDHPVTATPLSESRKAADGLSRRHAIAALAVLPVAGIPTSAPAMPVEPDPIFKVIERHRAAVAARSEAVKGEFGFEEGTVCVRNMNPEQLRHYETLEAATVAAWAHLDDVSGDLVNTKPTTLAGIVALCRYLEPILNDPHAVDLPEFIHWEDGTESMPAAAFANVIAAAAKGLIGRTA